MSQREWMEKDYYGILGVSKDASKADIKKAYRKLAQKYHPDANKGDAAAEKRFKEISEAHAILSNDEKRAEYDQMRQFVEAGGQRFYGFRPGGGNGNVRVNIGDIGDLFGGGGGAGGGLFEDFLGFRGAQSPRPGNDLEAQVELSFEDAVYGATIEVNGTKVRIAPGVKNGARIKATGRGEAGPNAGRAGDLYVVVHVRPHPYFAQGNNGDLIVHVPVTIAEAALGAKVTVPTLDGQVTLKVPAGTAHGKTLRARGKGAPRAKGGHGDLLAKIEIEIPQKLTKEEKDALETFARVHKSNPRAHLDEALTQPDARRAS
jgi:molecular chaperone DnaJ